MKLNRFVASTPPGIAITAGLFLLMQQLIDSGEPVIVRSADLPSPFLVQVIDRVATPPRDSGEPPPAPIVKPVAVPDQRSVYPPESNDVRPVEPRGPAAPRPPAPNGTDLLQWSDSPLVSVVRVAPQYPPRASAEGREGFVIVRFDVLPDGTVGNAGVVESSDGVFHREALRAVAKFRYKARVVDGQPQTTRGVQTLFRFEMKDRR